MTNIELANKAKDIANNYKTLYVMGGIGFPMSSSRKTQCMKQYQYNAKRSSMVNAASADTFGFDCVGLIKSILWGWNGDTSNALGGAKYASNGVPDIDENAMFKRCSGASTDFSKIEIGEAVWMSGHIGIYIGDGLAVEATPAWKNKVQITACNCSKAGYNRRNWTKHGKLPYVSYVSAEEKPQAKPTTAAAPKPAETSFLPEKGYWTYGDKDARIEKLCKYLYDFFPAYADVLGRQKKNLLGNEFGPNCKAWIIEFQNRTAKQAFEIYGGAYKDFDSFKKEYADGNVGPMTYAILKKYGFKE